MPYFSLVDRRRRRHGWDSASMSSSSSSDSDSGDDSGHGQDCLPAPKLPCALRSGWTSHLSDLGTTSGTSSATTSTSTSASSSGLGSSACVKPTNYASSSNGIAEPASIGTKLEVAKTAANIESGSSSKTGFPLIGNSGHDKYARPPNWDALLFGGPERSCQEILTYPEGDTYFEDCKLAGDVALNMVANNIDVPVFNNLRNCNQTQVTNALRSLRRSRGVNKFLNCQEELLAYVALLDFLTCCCQEGNLFPLYEKCKDSRKRYHIAMIDDDLKFLLEKLKSKAINLEQLRSLEKFILASLERIPKSLMNSFSVKLALQKKIQSFKETEKNRHEKSEYHFDDSSPEPPCKKWKPSISSCCKPKGHVVATSKNWREQTISPEFLPQTFCDDFDASCNKSKVVKTSTPKKDTNKYEPSTSSASTSMQAVKTSTPKIVTNEFKQPKMNSYSNISSMQKTSLTSPYKSKKLAWSSKYVSPSKQAISKTLPMGKNVLDPRRDTNNVIRNLCLSNDKPMATTSQAAMKYKSPSKGCTLVLARKEPGRSPLKLKVTNAVLKQMPLQSFILARKETGRSPLKLKVDNPTHKVPVQSLVKVNLKELAENTPGQSFIKVKLAPQANTKNVAENVAVQADVRMGAQKVQVQSLPKSNVKNVAQKVPVQTVLMATMRNGSGKVPVKPVLKANFRST